MADIRDPEGAKGRCQSGWRSGERHLLEGRHGAFGHGEIGFAQGAVGVGGAGGGFKTVGEEEALEGDAGGPSGFEGHDVFGVENEEFALGFEHARVGGEHQAVFFGRVECRLFGRGEAFRRDTRWPSSLALAYSSTTVAARSRSSEGNALLFELGAIEIGGGGGDIALIAIEDGNLHGNFGDAFPADGLREGTEGFVVVFETTAQLKIGNGLAFGASDFGGGTSAGGIGNARGWSLRGDDFDDLVFVDFRPGVVEIAGDDGLRKIGLADDGDE